MKYELGILPERVLNKIQFSDSCWNWLGWTNVEGYGKISWGKSDALAHRIVFSFLVRKPKKNLVLDHLCENKRCVNPSHLNETTIALNSMRSGKSVGAINAKKTHCPKGHPYRGRNLLISYRGIRMCRTCRNARALYDYYRTTKLKKAPKETPFGGK